MKWHGMTITHSIAVSHIAFIRLSIGMRFMNAMASVLMKLSASGLTTRVGYFKAIASLPAGPPAPVHGLLLTSGPCCARIRYFVALGREGRST